jgi:hypothetical protein
LASCRDREDDCIGCNGTWNLVHLLIGKKAIGCKWVFTVKVNPDGSAARLKARLVAKGYAYTYGVDYSDTFSPVAKLQSVHHFFSLVATYDWPLYQLGIKNAFLRGNLREEVYMEQPRGLLLRGSMGRYVISVSPCMVHGLGLENLVRLLMHLE